MPRIKEIKVSAFNETQDISDDCTITITGDISSDLCKAVVMDHDCEDENCEFVAMVVAGAPITAACMLIGATEVAHIDAVACAYKFSGKIPPMWPDWISMPDAQAWMDYHDKHGRQCSCGSFLYDDDDTTCSNCLRHVPQLWVRKHIARMTGMCWFKVVDESENEVTRLLFDDWDDAMTFALDYEFPEEN